MMRKKRYRCTYEGHSILIYWRGIFWFLYGNGKEARISSDLELYRKFVQAYMDTCNAYVEEI